MLDLLGRLLLIDLCHIPVERREIVHVHAREMGEGAAFFVHYFETILNRNVDFPGPRIRRAPFRCFFCVLFFFLNLFLLCF